MNGPREFAVRRIVVAVDSSAAAQEALEAAAALAARLNAELIGLFVEDIDLVNLAGLPVGREIRLSSGQTREFDQLALEEGFRIAAARARRYLQQMSARSRVVSTFRTVRGRVETEVVAAAAEGDLLILGTAARSVGFRWRPGSIAAAAAARAPRSVLIMRPGGRLEGKALLIYDGSPGRGLALEAALRLVSARDDALTVLLVAADVAQARSLEAEVRERLAHPRLSATFMQIQEIAVDELCRLSAQAGSDVLVMSGDSPVLAGEAHARLLEGLGCPVLIVR
jgi:nucleotide-binding universal stress UspA family protein